MPTNSAIPLSVKPIQIDDPAQKILTLRNMAQQQQMQAQETQLRDQQMKENAFKLAEQQRAAEGDAAQAKLLTANTAVDPATGLSKTDHQQVYQGLAALGYGDRADHYLATAPVNEANLNALQISEITKSAALYKMQGDMLGHVLDAPPEQRATAWQTQRANLATIFKNQPQMLQGIPAEYPGDAAAQHLSELGRTHEEILANALKAADAKKASAEADKAAAEAENLRKYGAATPPSLQSEAKLVNGKPTDTTFNPRSGKRTATDPVTGREIDVTGKTAPIPPASIQIQNMGAAAAASAPPVDAARPDPKAGNKIDPLTGMTPNAMYQGALEYALTKAMPSIGLGQSPRAMAVRAGVMNKAGAIAAAAGVDLPTVQAEYKANSAALGKIVPIATMTAAAAGTAADNLDLALAQSPEVARSGAKFANRYTQWAQGELTPAKGLAQFELYIYTAAREYAKVTSGSAASTQGLTDSASREASKLINAAQAPDVFASVAQGMKKDMANVTGNQTKAIATVNTTLGSFFGALNQGSAGAAPAAPSPAAASGKIDPMGIR